MSSSVVEESDGMLAMIDGIRVAICLCGLLAVFSVSGLAAEVETILLPAKGEVLRGKGTGKGVKP